MKNFDIALDDVSITSVSFGKEFTHDPEAKQVAAQEAERAKFIVEKAEQDRKVSGHKVGQRMRILLVRPSPTILLSSRSDRLGPLGRSHTPSQAPGNLPGL